MKAIRIGNHLVGNGHPCFIIAEAGVNHNGSIARALKLVDAAKAAGADAVKFQTFTAQDLVTNNAAQCDYQTKNTGNKKRQFAMLKRLELCHADFLTLKNHCDSIGILFLSTPHTLPAAHFLNDLVPCFKLSSGDLTNTPLLTHIASYKKPVILGTGMSTMLEVVQAIKTLHTAGCTEIIPLHCTTSYPCSEHEVHLKAMQNMRDSLKCVVGYSDHTLGIEIALMAVSLGAVVLEKHFTLNKKLHGPDHQASLNKTELTKLITAIKNEHYPVVTQKVLGNKIKRPSSTEKQIAKIVRKSIVLAMPLSKGTLITAKHLTVKRPGTGTPPSELQYFIGKTAVCNLEPDHLITLKNVRRRHIIYVSGTRADYGLMRTTLKAIHHNPSLKLTILATGMHLMPEFGTTIHEIIADGFIVKKLHCTFKHDDILSMARFAGEVTYRIAPLLTSLSPDILLLLGDRAEILAAATAATYLGIPLAHIHGGDVTATVDEIARHAITKLSHIHFAATEKSAARIKKMGEKSALIFNYGAPGVDAIHGPLLSAPELSKKYQINLNEPLILVLQHANSVEVVSSTRHYQSTLEALKTYAYRTIIIYPNADAGGRSIIKELNNFNKNSFVSLHKSIPYTHWLSLMKHASMLIGNSSSGIIEAPALHLPVINIGTRQQGRERATYSIDVPPDTLKITAAIKKVLSPRFRTKIKKCRSPYGTGTAGKKIAQKLATIALTSKLIQKRLAY